MVRVERLAYYVHRHDAMPFERFENLVANQTHSLGKRAGVAGFASGGESAFEIVDGGKQVAGEWLGAVFVFLLAFASMALMSVLVVGLRLAKQREVFIALALRLLGPVRHVGVGRLGRAGHVDVFLAGGWSQFGHETHSRLSPLKKFRTLSKKLLRSGDSCCFSISANSCNSSRWRSFRFRGVTTATGTIRSPRRFGLFTSGMPLPSNRSRAPAWVPGSMRWLSGPSSVGISTVAPIAASAKVSGTGSASIR